MVSEGCPLFHGTARQNDFLYHLAGTAFDPAFGTGRIEVSEDGTTVSCLWIHVDDILIHGTKEAKVQAALDYTMGVVV
jgi:hypothetical protein